MAMSLKAKRMVNFIGELISFFDLSIERRDKMEGASLRQVLVDKHE